MTNTGHNLLLLLLSVSTRVCKDYEWECHDGRRCIPQGRVCNGIHQCTDGSDEDVDFCNTWNVTKCEAGNLPTSSNYDHPSLVTLHQQDSKPGF